MENYILHITSGKGPAECCLAVALTLKQVLEEAEEAKLETIITERVQGMENRTLLSATVMISGKNAKLFCDSWSGVLLWICQSPFRKFHKRKNWFVGIQVFEKSKLAIWKESDVIYQTMRSSGPGGQNVNKVESAVRATHKTSGLFVVSKDSRSQLQNKKLATERLKQLFDQKQISEVLKIEEVQWQNHNSLKRGNPKRIYKDKEFKIEKNYGDTITT
ncbi:MAG: peptide chain release factor H [Bacteroidota bacterium]|nr:peptide chain release factor H [Bacteroidota bacterium]